MAIHPTPAKLSEEAIDEYLAIVAHCVTNRKANGGIYGYPAALLLFCVVDSLSNHAGHKKNTLRVLNDRCFGLRLSKDQLERLNRWYRNLLAHRAMIAAGTALTDETEGDAFEFSAKGEPTKIRVPALYHLVHKRGTDSARTAFAQEMV